MKSTSRYFISSNFQDDVISLFWYITKYSEIFSGILNHKKLFKLQKMIDWCKLEKNMHFPLFLADFMTYEKKTTRYTVTYEAYEYPWFYNRSVLFCRLCMMKWVKQRTSERTCPLRGWSLRAVISYWMSIKHLSDKVSYRVLTLAPSSPSSPPKQLHPLLCLK